MHWRIEERKELSEWDWQKREGINRNKSERERQKRTTRKKGLRERQQKTETTRRTDVTGIKNKSR